MHEAPFLHPYRHVVTGGSRYPGSAARDADSDAPRRTVAVLGIDGCIP
jgi:hypothetical protein